jgi:hypothetical protein
MVAAFLKQIPQRQRDPGSLLDLDTAGGLTDEMLRDGKLRLSQSGLFFH